MPQSPSNVGMMSGVPSGVASRRPARPKPCGQRTTKGTRIDSSQGRCLRTSAWEPSMSPWSAVTIRIVLPASSHFWRVSTILAHAGIECGDVGIIAGQIATRLRLGLGWDIRPKVDVRRPDHLAERCGAGVVGIVRRPPGHDQAGTAAADASGWIVPPPQSRRWHRSPASSAFPACRHSRANDCSRASTRWPARTRSPAAGQVE